MRKYFLVTSHFGELCGIQKGVRLDEVGLGAQWVNRDPPQGAGVDFRPAKGRAQGDPGAGMLA